MEYVISSCNFIVLVKLSTLIFFFLLGKGSSVSFSFPSFPPNLVNNGIDVEKSAFFTPDGVLQLTRNEIGASLIDGIGRGSYSKPVQLFDPKTKLLTDFTTNFSFAMNGLGESETGDGLAFFIAPFDSKVPNNSHGGNLGLISENFSNDSRSTNPFVAVEFDTYENDWDPSANHVGINVNSIRSNTTVLVKTSMRDGSRKAKASVSYNSASQNLSVLLSYDGNATISGENISLSLVVDLKFLGEHVRVGFSAATGFRVQLHQVYSWSFNSTLEISTNNTNSSSEAPRPSFNAPNPTSESTKGVGKGQQVSKIGLGLGVGFGILCCGLGLVWFVFWRKRVDREAEAKEEEYDTSIDGEFERGAGPKRFAYRELSQATNNFSEEGKLGEGSFGGVYKGILGESNTEIAVKKVSKGSAQGKKEYISEVKIISRLRHRNLVQLIGWCHKGDEFLLVYEYLPNGSLDTHIFGGKPILPWEIRHKIALGLASSLLYLHEEWEQCVVHRDIKSSNIMLDLNFNAKLGDFGLARLVDHEMGLDTTVVAGTRGYMAPECFTTSKASKESDVYSFGVVTLEICCGRRPIVLNEEDPKKVMLVEWVWELYGRGQLVEAVDKGLVSMEWNDREMECVMIVGLWCCHPDPTCRPSIKQVMNALNFEAALPNLPPTLPVPMYYMPSFSISSSDTYSSYSVVTGSSTTASTTSANSSTSKPLLKFADGD
ncbi:L-type lectin-domain containing receptor kinase IX.1-like [Humulus lupulus]|uniref:L-type lectin-domain containing receptor kinase IX.1-like n=1 Tax=Humulus lupulus TaxID=3486 RepID=UPI002B40D0B1|nr:L-type lectin-domain containing receptor kinase IX.1-like [Humulus lupulus]